MVQGVFRFSQTFNIENNFMDGQNSSNSQKTAIQKHLLNGYKAVRTKQAAREERAWKTELG